MLRQKDLEGNIRESYAILHEYEAILRTSDRPEEKARARRMIQEQRTLIDGYQGEYRGLTGAALPDEVAQAAQDIASIDNASGEPQTKAEAGTSSVADTTLGTGQHWAVLVGVNKYEDQRNYGQLQVCVQDVHAIRDRLIAGDYDPARVRLLTDQTAELPIRANILTALQSVSDATDPNDLLLFYYSGHGDEDGGESYLVSRDGRRLVLQDTAVPVSRVEEIMSSAQARAKVIVLDACHSGADIGGKGPRPMSEAFIRRVFEQAEGIAILASCKQGQLSYEWQAQAQSVFTHYLLEALAGEADRDGKGFVTVQDANRHVVDRVKLWASQNNVIQTPTLQYEVSGDIILLSLTERSHSTQRSYGTEEPKEYPPSITPDRPLLIGIVVDLSRSMRDLLARMPRYSGISRKRLNEAINTLVEKAMAFCKTPEADEILPRFALFIYGYGFGRFRHTVVDVARRIGIRSERLMPDLIPSEPVRDLLAEGTMKENLPSTPNASDISEHWDHYKQSVEGQFADAWLGPSILYDSLCAARDRFREELRRPYYGHPLLIVISNGELENAQDDDLDKVVNEIQRLGIQIVCCYFSTKNLTEAKRLHAVVGDTWPLGLRRLFRCSSTVSESNEMTRSIAEIAREHGWKIPTNAKLLIQVNHRDMLEELTDILVSPLRN